MRIGVGWRWLGAAVAAVVVAAGLYVVVASPFDGPTAPNDEEADRCSPDGDLLALQLNSGARDEPDGSGFHGDGLSSIGIVRSADPELRYLNEIDQVVHDPSFSPSGDRVAVMWADGDYESAGPSSESIWVMDTDDGEARPLTTGPSDRSPAWSPDGRWIAFSSIGPRYEREGEARHGWVGLVAPDGGPTRLLADLGEGGSVGGVAWLPSGEELIAWMSPNGGNDPSVLWRVGLDGQKEEVADLDHVVVAGEVDPTGSTLVITGWLRGSDGQRLGHVSIDLASGRARTLEGVPDELRWTPSGDRLYLGDRDPQDGTREAAEPGIRLGRLTEGSLEVERDGEGLPVGVRFDHQAFLEQFDVGPCTDPPATGPRPDRPLFGTEWVLGPERLVVAEGDPVEGCEAPSCTPIRIEASTRQVPDTTCTVLTGLLRGDRVTDTRIVDHVDHLATRCWSGEGWDDHPPTGLAVDGDILRFTLGPYDVEQRFGALDVGD